MWGPLKAKCANLLGRSVTILDAPVDERGDRSGRLLDGIALLGDGELLHQLVKNLDALGVLGSDHFGWFLRFRGEVDGVERTEEI